MNLALKRYRLSIWKNGFAQRHDAPEPRSTRLRGACIQRAKAAKLSESSSMPRARSYLDGADDEELHQPVRRVALAAHGRQRDRRRGRTRARGRGTLAPRRGRRAPRRRRVAPGAGAPEPSIAIANPRSGAPSSHEREMRSSSASAAASRSSSEHSSAVKPADTRRLTDWRTLRTARPSRLKLRVSTIASSPM